MTGPGQDNDVLVTEETPVCAPSITSTPAPRLSASTPSPLSLVARYWYSLTPAQSPEDHNTFCKLFRWTFYYTNIYHFQALDLELLESGGRTGPRSVGSGGDSEGHSLKFFDPLRSPDEEMMRVEVELMRRAADIPNPANIPINHGVALHKNINLEPAEQRPPRQRFKSSTSASSSAAAESSARKPNIDSFITQNLDGLKEIKSRNPTWTANSVPSNFHHHLASAGALPPAGLGQEGNVAGQKKTFTISDSVREELREAERRRMAEVARAKPRPPPPPRPSEGPRAGGGEGPEDPLYMPMSELSSPAPVRGRRAGSGKRVLRSTASCATLASTDSVYATVDKSKKRSGSRASGENFYQSVDISSASTVARLHQLG